MVLVYECGALDIQMYRRLKTGVCRMADNREAKNLVYGHGQVRGCAVGIQMLEVTGSRDTATALQGQPGTSKVPRFETALAQLQDVKATSRTSPSTFLLTSPIPTKFLPARNGPRDRHRSG